MKEESSHLYKEEIKNLQHAATLWQNGAIILPPQTYGFEGVK